MDYAKPVILVSSCLGFDQCNYRGKSFMKKIVEPLKRCAHLRAICPEGGMGLLPSQRLRLVAKNEGYRLIQPESGVDFTDKMNEYAFKTLESLVTLDGCILKSKSPTCGIRDVKIYKSADDDIPVKKGKGLFADYLERLFPNALVEDEGRLANPRIRDSFFSALFTKADFRRAIESRHMESLRAFHQKNRLLFMVYSQTSLRDMDKLLLQKGASFEEVIFHYERLMNACLKRTSRLASHGAVLKEVFALFSPLLKSMEQEFLASRLNLFCDERLPLSSLIVLCRANILRFSDEIGTPAKKSKLPSDIVLKEQTYFSPFPETLNTL